MLKRIKVLALIVIFGMTLIPPALANGVPLDETPEEDHVGEYVMFNDNDGLELGSETKAGGVYSAAFGDKTKANGDYSIAMGYRTEATGLHSLSIGQWSKALGKNSFAGGIYSQANGDISLSFGYNASSNGHRAVAIGQYNSAQGYDSMVLGSHSTAYASNSMVIGYGMKSNIGSSLSIGFGNPYYNGQAADGHYLHTPSLFVGTGDYPSKRVGYVGVGTNTPESALDVRGQLTIKDGQEAEGKVLVSDADGKASWKDLSSIPGAGSSNGGSADLGDIPQRITSLENHIHHDEHGIVSNHRYINRVNGQLNQLQTDFNNVTKSDNVILGSSAGLNYTGDTNILIGKYAGQNSNGVSNVSLGLYAAEDSKNSSYSVNIGDMAGWNSEGTFNVFLGSSAGSRSLGNMNVAIGYGAGSGSEGRVNIFIGQAGSEVNGEGNILLGNKNNYITGSDNLILGQYAPKSWKDSYDDTIFQGRSLDNKFIVSNSRINSVALLYGDFKEKTLELNADVEVNGRFKLPGGSAGQVLVNRNGVATWETLSGSGGGSSDFDHSALQSAIALNASILNGVQTETDLKFNRINNYAHRLNGRIANLEEEITTQTLGLDEKSNLILGSELQNGNPLSSSTVIGHDSGTLVTRSNSLKNVGNTLIGEQAGASSKNLIQSTFIGNQAGSASSNQTFSVLIGSFTGKNSNGVGNVFVGDTAGYRAKSRNSEFIGAQSGKFSQGDRNIYLGRGAGLEAIGDDNVFIGTFAGTYFDSSPKRTGYHTNDTLVISNQPTLNPLVYGKFDTTPNDSDITGLFKINGNFEVQGSVLGSSSAIQGSVLTVTPEGKVQWALPQAGNGSAGDNYDHSNLEFTISSNTAAISALQENGSKLSNIHFNTLSTIIGENTGKGRSLQESTVIGREAGLNAYQSEWSTYIGKEAGKNAYDTRRTIAIGDRSGYQTRGGTNVMLGNNIERLEGYQNTLVGHSSAANSKGSHNSYFGFSSGNSVDGNHNSSLGYLSLSKSNGSYNVAIGDWAAFKHSGDKSISIGQSAGQDSSGDNNI